MAIGSERGVGPGHDDPGAVRPGLGAVHGAVGGVEDTVRITRAVDDDEDGTHAHAHADRDAELLDAVAYAPAHGERARQLRSVEEGGELVATKARDGIDAASPAA